MIAIKKEIAASLKKRKQGSIKRFAYEQLFRVLSSCETEYDALFECRQLISQMDMLVQSGYTVTGYHVMRSIYKNVVKKIKMSLA